MLFGWLVTDKVLDSDFARNSSETSTSSTPVGYYNDLVPVLESEHRDLLDIYSYICAAATQSRIADIQSLLLDLVTVFNAHALHEYTKLFVCLDQHYACDTKLASEIQALKLEMQQFGKALRKFCHDWRHLPIEDFNLSKFNKDLNILGDALGKRLVKEETRLYPLYELEGL